MEPRRLADPTQAEVTPLDHVCRIIEPNRSATEPIVVTETARHNALDPHERRLDCIRGLAFPLDLSISSYFQ